MEAAITLSVIMLVVLSHPIEISVSGFKMRVNQKAPTSTDRQSHDQKLNIDSGTASSEPA